VGNATTAAVGGGHAGFVCGAGDAGLIALMGVPLWLSFVQGWTYSSACLGPPDIHCMYAQEVLQDYLSLILAARRSAFLHGFVAQHGR
jgi:hypothetical protein